MLYFIATPIGNLGDISFRAVQTLKEVDVIACEDTRHSLVFLSHYEIKKQLVSYHKFNERESALKICQLLEEGKNVAVISDAGTPIISDPGNVLSQVLIEKGLPFTVIPGACAFVPALILSGLDCSRFTFVGFLPDKASDALRMLEDYVHLKSPLVFYVPPHDVDSVVSTLYKAFGDRRAVAVREITKMFEQRIEFTLKDGYQGERRGEFVLVVDGASIATEEMGNPLDKVEELIKLGVSKMDAIKEVAKESGMRKNQLYKLVLEAEENK